MANKWGWTSYRKTGWLDENEKPIYRANFQTTPRAGGAYERSSILFSASRPILALRYICEQGVEPGLFHNRQIN